MSKLPIINVPDPLLKTVSEPVAQVDDALRGLMDDMLETMYDAPGIGLAAIQVAVPKRLLVVDVADTEGERQPRFLVNPEVVWASDERSIYNEGCLSVPEHYAEVERPERIRVSYLDYDGKPREEEMDGLLATCVQHEIDHLNGVVFIDYLSKLRRNMIIKKVVKANKDAVIL
ncbi:peptide deformylase [Eilatimonas milleporae]|uniref:Peptide deformylase n=1 Tax=Eilatimonas milleporae TaxID=911205 RepID=A0A3M0BXY3_9PROT|nr:peptide deformylase [Eilatimonas milleporae]RMB01902.1 peptide deformylase [Eilatimonas milleporae]